ncbi:hypothetical protein B0J14DRAFT_686833 [Halenospora varia]|nr:hypothetical protein B0J14DRAFT_686833 [Halenospora varia]
MDPGMSQCNCTHYPGLDPNPDISGIGVLSSFLGIAYLTFGCCMVKAVNDHKRSGFEFSTRLDRWSFTLGNAILILSDEQIVTGISVMVGALSQLSSGIQTYHWETVVNLAWFSTITHIIILAVLRDEARANKPVLAFRIAGIAILISMLIYVAFPTGFIASQSSLFLDTSGLPPLTPLLNFPAWCLYGWKLPWMGHPSPE